MRIKLELESKDEFHFATHRSSIAEPYRSLVIRLNGRPFATWYRLREDYRADYNAGYLRHVDEVLAEQFESMLGKLVDAAIAMVPDGVDFVQMSESEIRELLTRQKEKETA